MKDPQILLSSDIAILISHMALAGHHQEGEKMEPIYDTPEAMVIDGEAESNSESDADDSSDAPASANGDSEESTYSTYY